MIGIKTLATHLIHILTAFGSVGSIYITTSDTNPQAIFGGKWDKVTDRFLVGGGGSYAVSATVANTGGGANTHTLAVAQMPAHNHFVVCSCDHASTRSGSTHSYVWKNNGGGSRMPGVNGIIGVTPGQAHENKPPYKAVYIWQRVK